MFNKNEASKLNGLETSDLGTNMNKLSKASTEGILPVYISGI